MLFWGKLTDLLCSLYCIYLIGGKNCNKMLSLQFSCMFSGGSDPSCPQHSTSGCISKHSRSSTHLQVSYAFINNLLHYKIIRVIFFWTVKVWRSRNLDLLTINIPCSKWNILWVYTDFCASELLSIIPF